MRLEISTASLLPSNSTSTGMDVLPGLEVLAGAFLRRHSSRASIGEWTSQHTEFSIWIKGAKSVSMTL